MSDEHTNSWLCGKCPAAAVNLKYVAPQVLKDKKFDNYPLSALCACLITGSLHQKDDVCDIASEQLREWHDLLEAVLTFREGGNSASV